MKNIIFKIFPRSLPDFDVINNPFSQTISSYLLLYPTEVCMLTEAQYYCLQAFLSEIGETKFIVTDSVRMADEQSSEPKYIEFLQSANYSQLEETYFMPTTAFYSYSASWGLIISDEQYAIIGTTESNSSIMRKAFIPNILDWKKFSEDYIIRNDLPNRDYNKDIVDSVLRWVL